MSKKSGTASADKAVETMEKSCEYHVMHREAVRRKLEHAQTATQQSFKELDQSQKAANEKNISEEIGQYEEFWRAAIESFDGSFVSEGMLTKIEKILKMIPSFIKKFYDVLVKSDRMLSAIIEKLGLPEYQDANDLVQKTQGNAEKIMAKVWPQVKNPVCRDDQRVFKILPPGMAARAVT